MRWGARPGCRALEMGSRNSKQAGEGTGWVAKHSFWKWQSPPQWTASYDCARTPHAYCPGLTASSPSQLIPRTNGLVRSAGD